MIREPNHMERSFRKTHDITSPLSKIPFSPQIATTMNEYFYARLLLLKRTSFQFENEFRIMIVENKKQKDVKGIHIPFQIPLQDLIKRITLDPRLEPNTVLFLKQALKNLLSHNPKIEFCQSNLYKSLSTFKEFIVSN